MHCLKFLFLFLLPCSYLYSLPPPRISLFIQCFPFSSNCIFFFYACQDFSDETVWLKSNLYKLLFFWFSRANQNKKSLWRFNLIRMRMKLSPFNNDAVHCTFLKAIPVADGNQLQSALYIKIAYSTRGACAK